MPDRAEINLAELAKAMHALAPQTKEEEALIARCLGFSIGRKKGHDKTSRTQHAPRRGAWNRRRQNQPTAKQPLPNYKPGYAIPPPPQPEPEVNGNILETVFKQLDDAKPTADATITPDLLQNIETLLSKSAAPAPARKLLFPRKTARAIITESISQPVPGYDIDIAKLIRSHIRLQPLKRLPYKKRHSINHGCQLLLDFSEALMPWWEDMRTLIEQFQSVLGEKTCPVYEFEDKPAKAIQWTETKEIEWQPEKRRPVIIASDLGYLQTPNAQIRSGKQDWLKLLGKCAQANVPIIVLNPLIPEKWDSQLSQQLNIIHWNPGTTAAEIKYLMQTARDNRR